jgi:hypothetical protein
VTARKGLIAVAAIAVLAGIVVHQHNAQRHADEVTVRYVHNNRVHTETAQTQTLSEVCVLPGGTRVFVRDSADRWGVATDGTALVHGNSDTPTCSRTTVPANAFTAYAILTGTVLAAGP